MDPSTLVEAAVTDLGGEFAAVGAAGLAIGVAVYGAKRVWGFFKGIAR
jgi:hypothetical protein